MAYYEIISAEKKIVLDLVSSSTVVVDGQALQIDCTVQNNGLTLLKVDGRSYQVYCMKLTETTYEIYFAHHIIPIEILDHRKQLLEQFQKQSATQSGIIIVKAPMPGLVTAIEVKLGDVVEPGTGLIVLEAMKMENEIRSSVRGRIKSIDVKEQMAIEKNQVLLHIEAMP